MYESMAPGGLPIAPAPAAPAAARTPEAKHSGSFESSGTTANQSNNRGGSVSNNARNSSSSNINSNSNSKGSIISSSSKRNKSDTAIPTLKSATLLPSPGSRNEAVKLEDVKESSSSTTATGTSAGQQKKRKWTVEERSQHSVVEKRRREDLNLKLLVSGSRRCCLPAGRSLRQCKLPVDAVHSLTLSVSLHYSAHLPYCTIR